MRPAGAYPSLEEIPLLILLLQITQIEQSCTHANPQLLRCKQLQAYSHLGKNIVNHN